MEIVKDTQDSAGKRRNISSKRQQEEINIQDRYLKDCQDTQQKNYVGRVTMSKMVLENLECLAQFGSDSVQVVSLKNDSLFLFMLPRPVVSQVNKLTQISFPSHNHIFLGKYGKAMFLCQKFQIYTYNSFHMVNN